MAAAAAYASRSRQLLLRRCVAPCLLLLVVALVIVGDAVASGARSAGSPRTDEVVALQIGQLHQGFRRSGEGEPTTTAAGGGWPALNREQQTAAGGKRRRRMLVGSRDPTCTYNECRGCRHRCSVQEVPIDASDPINSAYHYKCICHL